ncbi:DUF2497 domain-containing protein [uncultured Sphingomonas sp.]|uniref:DUF2497 domain-containing protein n=1 Tax=uncultured Sphingomonas sp. TaxID=158754 RepID=UPI0035C9753C
MGDVSAEPSMEDILSSIKRIIAEDGDPASRPRRRMGSARSSLDDPADDVLVLSDPAPEPAMTPVSTVEPAASSPAIGQPVAERAMRELAPGAPEPVSFSPAAAETIVSPGTAEASRSTLDTLSRLIVRPEVTGSDTLEGMVRDMLRPILREWLDANLPDMVERMVAREISRITGQR